MQNYSTKDSKHNEAPQLKWRLMDRRHQDGARKQCDQINPKLQESKLWRRTATGSEGAV